jgi:preprotein translocase subunit SecD
MNEKFKKQAEQQKKESKDETKPDSKLDQFKDQAVPAEKKAPAKTQKKEEVTVPEPVKVYIPKVIEYTHATSAQAKETQLMKKGELKATVANADTKVKDARMKLAAAREELEKDKKAKKIKEAVYLEKLDKIMKAEKAVNDLELSVQKGKDLTAE